MIVLGIVAVLSTTVLLALRMVLNGADPRQRAQLLTAIAGIVRAWRSPERFSNGRPRQ